ncbi:3-methyladenine DNA glycosylase [Bacillus sp. CMF12]|nr:MULTISPECIES: 3-methyladenine DNA glycosylase [Bacillaceae]MBX9972053.1 3-methyladenine DNA glycosylase [Cytobacillus firmus]MDM5226521.1 3-methyladenine DNA glycosylase [Cytobacillus sp. NJ13]UOE56861.1 3-methyladenine DNA glycosylase [Cytobacillus oceanisediminis]USK51354.1 3-methyladenine DNA glycosylase [Bacillus sp. CMF12]
MSDKYKSDKNNSIEQEKKKENNKDIEPQREPEKPQEEKRN